MADNEWTKDPSAVLDYKFDWAAETNGTDTDAGDWLDTDNSETISEATITVDTGLTEDSSSLTDTNTSVTVWLSGGTAGNVYKVACEITTSAARTDERTIYIKCEQR